MWIPNIDPKLWESIVYRGMILCAHTGYIYGRSALKGSSWQQDICMSAPGLKFFSLFSLSGIHAGANGFLQPFFFSLFCRQDIVIWKHLFFDSWKPHIAFLLSQSSEKRLCWNDWNIIDCSHLQLSDKSKNAQNMFIWKSSDMRCWKFYQMYVKHSS